MQQTEDRLMDISPTRQTLLLMLLLREEPFPQHSLAMSPESPESEATKTTREAPQGEGEGSSKNQPCPFVRESNCHKLTPLPIAWLILLLMLTLLLILLLREEPFPQHSLALSPESPESEATKTTREAQQREGEGSWKNQPCPFVRESNCHKWTPLPIA